MWKILPPDCHFVDVVVIVVNVTPEETQGVQLLSRLNSAPLSKIPWNCAQFCIDQQQQQQQQKEQKSKSYCFSFFSRLCPSLSIRFSFRLSRSANRFLVCCCRRHAQRGFSFFSDKTWKLNRKMVNIFLAIFGLHCSNKSVSNYTKSQRDLVLIQTNYRHPLTIILLSHICRYILFGIWQSFLCHDFGLFFGGYLSGVLWWKMMFFRSLSRK